MPALPYDISRCDGLLPKLTKMTNGMDAILWSIDCPHRETCLRFIHAFQPDEPSHISYISHHHKPDQPCPDLLETTHSQP